MLKIFVLCALLAYLSGSQAASNDGFVIVKSWPELTTKKSGTRWIKVDENAAEKRMPNGVVSLKNGGTVINLEDERNYSPGDNDPTKNDGFVIVKSWPEPATKDDFVIVKRWPEPITKTSPAKNDRFVIVKSWPEPATKDDFVIVKSWPEPATTKDNLVIVKSWPEPDNQDKNDDGYDHNGDNHDDSSTTNKPSTIEVTKKKDCSPKSKELKKAMYEWGYSNAPSLDKTSEKVCPKTCSEQNMEWKGAYGSLDGTELKTCQCEKRLSSNIYSSRSSNMEIDMRQCEKSFCDAMFNLHNDYRTKHRVENLTVDNSLSMQANEYALELIESGKFEKSQNGDLYGESIVLRQYINAPVLTDDICTDLGRKATAMWYDQSKNYDFKIFDSKTDDEAIDEFTQMVWKNSNMFGCGLATNGSTFVAVARYTPKGNKPGEYEANVFPAISSLRLIGWPFVNA